MTELQQKLLNSLKDSGFRKTPMDLWQGKENEDQIRESLRDLQAKGYVLLLSDVTWIRVTNKAWVAMSWVSSENAAEDVARVVALEQKLREVLKEMGQLGQVQFWDVESDYIYELAGVEHNFTDGKMYVKLCSPPRRSQATSAFAEM